MPEFDVFLCHNSQDKPEVIEIARQLQERGLKPWLDAWELRPGLPWQRELEKQITNIGAAAVFIGKSGFGPWHEMEIEVYLRRFVRKGSPVIPILLPDAPKEPELLPPFLEGMTWIDFRHSESNPMSLLIWGITGIKPADLDLNSAQSSTSETKTLFKASKKTNKSFIEYLGKGVNLEMIYIPGDTFMMGSPKDEGEKDEKPQHEVIVPSFFMGKYPVTQAQYRQITGQNPSYFKNNDQRPVESISWDDAVEFCEMLSKQTEKKYRLPSEAEWEYACRAKTTTAYHFGNNITDKLANYDRNIGVTNSVEKFLPNAFGLYDMHGNVLEWCQDNWHENYQDAPIDGSAWLSGDDSKKVIRGGSWAGNPADCRSAFRDVITHNYHINSIGFRVVCVAPRAT